jgi:hypothetical protein
LSLCLKSGPRKYVKVFAVKQETLMAYPVDPEELNRVSSRLGYPLKPSEAARAAKDVGASEELVDFLEAIPGEIADERDLHSRVEAANQPDPHPDNMDLNFPDVQADLDDFRKH